MDIYILKKKPSKITISKLTDEIKNCIESFMSTDIFYYLTHSRSEHLVKINQIHISEAGINPPLDFHEIKNNIKKQRLISCPTTVHYSLLKIEESLPSGVLYFRYNPQSFLFLLGEFGEKHNVAEIHCNLDNVSPERISTYQKALLKLNALDVWLEPIHMKKSRPAYKLCVLVQKSQLAYFQEWLLTNVPTLGIRYVKFQRLTLTRYEKEGKKIWYDLSGQKQEREEHDTFEKNFLNQNVND